MSQEILDKLVVPPAGWSTNNATGNPQFILHGPRPLQFRVPTKEGYECFFVATFGDKYTRFSYRPVRLAAQQERVERHTSGRGED